jgi:hypothetical protein
VIFADRIRSVGKQARGESGKYPVNEEDEEIATPFEYGNRDCAQQIPPATKLSTSLRAQRSNPCTRSAVKWIASLRSQ